MGQPTSSGQGELDHALDGHRVAVQVVKEGAVLVVVGDEPQLSPCSIICSRKETVLSTQPQSILLLGTEIRVRLQLNSQPRT